MRPDMHRKVIEKERRGSSNRSRKWSRKVSENYDKDGVYGRVKISRHGQYGWKAKDLSDNLGPLRGYLRSCIGRHWDDVYSELRKAVPRGLHGEHIMSHVRWEICDKAERREDGIYDLRTGRQTRPLHKGKLYVDPETGIVKKVKKGKTYRQHFRDFRATRESQTEPSTRIDGKDYIRVNGIWYLNCGMRETLYDGCPVKVPDLRQLNHKELKILGLTNSAEPQTPAA